MPSPAPSTLAGTSPPRFVEGPSIYSLTGELLALSAELLANGKARTSGIVSPIDAFGLDGLAEQSATIGLTRVQQ